MSSIALRAMTFNLRRRRWSDGEHQWGRRREAAAGVIRRWRPDVIGTQEGLGDQMADLLAASEGYAMVGEGRLGGAEDEFNAILYREERFDVLDRGNFWLSETPDVPGSMSWGNYCPRMVTWARFADRESGERFSVYNTHLDHASPGARRKSAALLHARMPRADEPVVLTGDFNSLPKSRVYRILERAGFVDALRLAEERKPERWGATFHHWTGRGLYRIDYIFLKQVIRVPRLVTVKEREALSLIHI